MTPFYRFLTALSLLLLPIQLQTKTIKGDLGGAVIGWPKKKGAVKDYMKILHNGPQRRAPGVSVSLEMPQYKLPQWMRSAEWAETCFPVQLGNILGITVPRGRSSSQCLEGRLLSKSFKDACEYIYSKFGPMKSPRLLRCLSQLSFWAQPLHVGRWERISRSCHRGDGKFVPRKPTTLNSLWAKSSK